MKKLYYSFVLFIFFVGACGSGSGKKELSLVIDWPEEIGSHIQDSLKVYGSLSDSEDIIESDIPIVVKEGRYEFEAIRAEEGMILLLKVFYLSSDSEFEIATVEKKLESMNETLEINRSDFTDIGGADPDDDGLVNLDEINAELDPLLADTDGDGVLDGEDFFPSLSNEWLDSDGDGIGDNSDSDIDGDSIPNDVELENGTDPLSSDSDKDNIIDSADNCPLVPNEDQTDSDGDGKGDACDDDSDGDGLSDSEELEYGTNPKISDTDGDGISDSIEIEQGTDPLISDTDGDGYNDKNDRFPLDPTEHEDSDNDGIADGIDNCPDRPNTNQANLDGDAYGDLCDDDIDGDGRDFVYVSSYLGDDLNPGGYSTPVKTLKRGMLLAYERGEELLVSNGSYDLKDAVFYSNMKIRGGYNGDNFSDLSMIPDDYRDIRVDHPQFRSVLYNSSSPITVRLGNNISGLVIEGFYIVNNFSSEYSTTIRLNDSESTVIFKGNKIRSNSEALFTKGVEIIGGEPILNANWIELNSDSDVTENIGIDLNNSSSVIKNNIIIAGEARHTISLRIKDSAPIVVNNSLDGGSKSFPPLTGAGVVIEESQVVLVNNIITALSNPGADSVALKCFGLSTLSGEIRNNIFSSLSGWDQEPLVVDCNGDLHYDINFSFGSAAVNNNHQGNQNLLSYPLGIDQGLDASNSDYGSVIRDYNYNERDDGNYDIGAREEESDVWFPF